MQPTPGLAPTLLVPHQYKLGRKPRLHLPQVPHLSAWVAGRSLAAIPLEVDYTTKMDSNFGMMLNDTLGCCTCSGVYHARQVWTANAPAGHELTDPDKDVLRLYEWAAGFRPGHPETDQGAYCQNILTYWQNHGVPYGKDMHWDRLLGFCEVDKRNIHDCKRVIYECGVAYIGFQVPQNILPPGAQPPKIWTVAGGEIIGGHCVVLAGYNATGAIVISWGSKYFMTWDFFEMYCDEIYGPINRAWFDPESGKDILGMTATDLKIQMAAINTLN